MEPNVRTQATLILSGLSQLKRLRDELDPEFARRIPPHVTLIYDDEASDIDLLIRRLRTASANARPVNLSLSLMARFQSPNDGLYIVTTASAEFQSIRHQVLKPPFSSRGPLLKPHITIVHPSRVSNISAAWQNYIGAAVHQSTSVASITIVEWDGSTWLSKDEIPLGGRDQPSSPSPVRNS
jgi:2'-5' RNA ligase